MIIRPFEEADEAAVIALWQRCGLTRPWNDPASDVRRKLTVQRDCFLVGVEDGHVLAAVMAGYDGHRGSVNYLAVDPARQGQGLGRRLMREIEARLLALGCPKINLQLREDNAQVQAFYEELGYVREERISMGKRLISDPPPGALTGNAAAQEDLP